MTAHLGVDGCRAGWIAAEASGLGERPRLWLARSFGEVVARGLAMEIWY